MVENPKASKYWKDHGIKPKDKQFRYQIFVDPTWLEESMEAERVNDPKHALHKQNEKGRRITKAELSRPKTNKRDLTGEREKNYHRLMIKLWLQACKARKMAAIPDYEIYIIRRTGAPGKNEWICNRTFRVAAQMKKDSESSQQLMRKHREYYRDVERFSVMTYNYLSDLSPVELSALLDAYIRQFMVFPLPFSYEFERVEAFMAKRQQNGCQYYGKIQCLSGTTKEKDLFGQSAEAKMQAVFLE
jgi:hypothetical protein